MHANCLKLNHPTPLSYSPDISASRSVMIDIIIREYSALVSANEAIRKPRFSTTNYERLIVCDSDHGFTVLFTLKNSGAGRFSLMAEIIPAKTFKHIPDFEKNVHERFIFEYY